MAIKDIFKINRRTFFDPVAWFGSSVKVTSSIIWNTSKNLFAPIEAKQQESFSDAIKRFGLHEADLEQIQTNYLVYCLIFLICAFSAFVYGFYLIYNYKTFSGLALSIAVTALFAAQAFRYHFWYFQIKHRKLGCSFEEWKSGTISNQDKIKDNRK